MEFLGFCIVVSTVIACDTWVFLHGYDSWFHEAKTDKEKTICEATIAARNKEFKVLKEQDWRGA